jgi:hypothetical protein
MNIRNDCRIERSYMPVVVSASGRTLQKGDPILPGTEVIQVFNGIRLDLCFAVGDAVTIKPRMQGLPDSSWYSAFPSNAVIFLGLDGFVDNNERLRDYIRDIGIADPPLPFFCPLAGIVHLPLSSLDHVLEADGPRRSQWVIRDVERVKLQLPLATGWTNAVR